MNYSNSQRAGVILNLNALLFGGYKDKSIYEKMVELLWNNHSSKDTELDCYSLAGTILAKARAAIDGG